MAGMQAERRAPTVLVVDCDRAELRRLANILLEEGYDALEAETFHDAVRSLRYKPAQVLVTTVRLGPYNGLHLIVRSRIAQPDIAAILTHHEDDRMLCGEAATNHAAFLPKPCTRESLTRAVATSLCLNEGRP
jgi:DNA-binding NtrC family response regulator